MIPKSEIIDLIKRRLENTSNRTELKVTFETEDLLLNGKGKISIEINDPVNLNTMISDVR